MAVYGATVNAIDHLKRAHIASGFGFCDTAAGFRISQTLIAYSADASTYGRAFWVGLLRSTTYFCTGLKNCSV